MNGLTLRHTSSLILPLPRFFAPPWTGWSRASLRMTGEKRFSATCKARRYVLPPRLRHYAAESLRLS
jgi:hypothetical protein